jgi:hypothetical protein
MKAWVHSEEHFASALGLTRLFHTHGNYGDICPDALGGFEYPGPPLLLESKSRKDGFPKLIENGIKQALAYKEAAGRVCVVGLHKNGGRGLSDYLIILRLQDFAEIVGRAYAGTRQ